MTDDRGQKTDDRLQKVEIRGQKPDDRGQMTEEEDFECVNRNAEGGDKPNLKT